MSYILEALKRADAERREEKLPGLQTPSTVAPSAGLPAKQRRLLVWASAGFILLVVMGLAWQQLGDSWTKPSTPSSTFSAASPASQSVQVAAVSAAPSVEKRDEQSSARPTTENSGPTRAAALPPPPPAAVLRAATPEPARPSTSEKQAKSDDASKPGLPTGVAPAVARPAPSQTIDRQTVEIAAVGPKKPVAEAPRMTELPVAVRRTLPVVTMGGYIYTADPASRSVVINGRLAREGEAIAPGLQLEQMRPKDAVFNYQGTRYRLSY